MDYKEVKGLSDEEITVELRRTRDKLYTLKSQMVTEKVEDTSKFKKIRADIARMLTEQTARKMAEAAS